MAYIQDALDLVEGQDSFNDPQAYIHYLNADNSIYEIQDFTFKLQDLKQIKNLETLDPFIWYSIYNNFVSYLWGGKPVGHIPKLRFTHFEYLPSVHIALTPFGVESQLENYLIIDEVLYMVNLRLGDESYYQSWGGLGFLVSYPFARSLFSADLSVDVWQQPAIKLGGNEREYGGGLGGAFSVRGYFKIPEAIPPMKAIVELGYKSVGFLEGYPLDASPVFVLGIQL